MEKLTNGKQVHFATTDDFLHIAEESREQTLIGSSKFTCANQNFRS